MPDLARLRAKRLFLLDLDGTLYLDERLFDGAADFLRAIRSRGGTYRFLTNNSSRGAESYVEKLRRLGVEAETSDFLTSVDALIAHLHAQGMAEKLLYVCGTQSMKRQLTQAGLRLTDDRDAAVDALVMGFDTELTFQKLEDACILLNRGADYLATNPDWVCPTWYGFVPDCGSVCEMLFRATGGPMSSASRGPIWRALRWRTAAFPQRRRCCSATGSTPTLPAARTQASTRCSSSRARRRRRTSPTTRCSRHLSSAASRII